MKFESLYSNYVQELNIAILTESCIEI